MVKEKYSRRPYLTDDLKKLVRGAAVVLPKDFGTVIAYTGIGKDSIIAEAGAGTGFVTVQLARICKKVYSYENREEHYRIARSNIEKLKLENVELKLDSIEHLDKYDLDLIFLDFKESDKFVHDMFPHIKKNGFLVGYCPNVEQAKSFHLNAQKSDYTEVFTLTSMITDHEIREFGCRPKNFGLIHTAYLVFAKK